MKLQNGDKAIIEDTKLWGYILNPHHPYGRQHAYLFKRLLDIDLSNWHVLKTALAEAARSANATFGRHSPHGEKYEVRFPMSGSRGCYTILSIWIVPVGQSVPRLVTAYIE